MIERRDVKAMQFSNGAYSPVLADRDAEGKMCGERVPWKLKDVVDHLNGTLFIDHMTKKVRTEIDAAVKELAKRTREASKPKA